jgi:phosphoglycerate kinase
MEAELSALYGALENPQRPFITIIGGAKISDKIGVIENLLGRVDALLIGGGMANTFLAAQGLDMADSLVEEESIATAKDLMQKANEKGASLLLPTDALVADDFSAEAKTQVVPVNAVPGGWRMLDIGPDTVNVFSNQALNAKTVIWNGPMGVFEMEPFAGGTRSVAEALVSATINSGAFTIVGGGDSVSAVEQGGFADKISHVSTGGGASLELLEGKELPGVAILKDK